MSAFDNIYNMYAHVLTRGLGVQLKKGLNKAYRDQDRGDDVCPGQDFHARDHPRSDASRNAPWCVRPMS